MIDDTQSPHCSGLNISLEHTLPAVIAHVAGCYGDKPFLIGEDGCIVSFKEFKQRVDALARALIARGVEHGDRVAIWAPNCPEWIIAASAIETIGAIMVPINTRFKGSEAGYVLSKTRARILFTVGSFLGSDYGALLAQACGGEGQAGPITGLPALQDVIRLDARELEGFLEQQSSAAELAARTAAVTPETIADILFTSGTTGHPKGAMHNHGQALWMVGQWNRSNDLRAGDRMIIINPFFHSFGYRSGWVSALVAGMTAYPVAVFDPASVLEKIERDRITVLMGPPTIFYALMNHPDFPQRDISSLRVGHTGSSNVPVDLIRAGRETLGFDIFLTSFGQTESTALITVNYPDDSLETIAGTVGRALPGVELKIVDATGRSLPDGESGELLVRGPNVMQGYFEDAEQTAATIDSAGWLHTGDVGCMGPDGTLRILDRLKDVVIVGGFNAYPAEIENTLRSHPAIADVSVIAWPDKRLGEVCAACVVLRPGTSLEQEELIGWCRDRMANYKVPRRLFLVEEFPRTPLGKVQKFLLRDTLLHLDAAPAAGANPIPAAVAGKQA